MTTLNNYMQDSRGRLVPRESIKPIDQERDALVKEIVPEAKALQQALQQFRRKVNDNITAFASLSAEQYGAPIGGKKGNITLISYDGHFKIVRAINDVLVFDERLQAAKELIDSCIHEWSAGSGKEIKTLVADAFQVDQQGHINTGRVLGLRRLAFDHPKWKSAMEAISDALLVATTKTYIRFYERDDSGKYIPINLDLTNA